MTNHQGRGGAMGYYTRALIEVHVSGRKNIIAPKTTRWYCGTVRTAVVSEVGDWPNHHRIDFLSNPHLCVTGPIGSVTSSHCWTKITFPTFFNNRNNRSCHGVEGEASFG
jgi:hypothetical protein